MPAPAGLDLSQLPTFSNLAPEDDRPKASPIIGGLAAGYHQLVGLGGSAIEGAGKLVGLNGVADYGKSVADNQAATAARVGRPDLDVAPWQQGGASVAPWLEYQAAKLVPTLAGYGAAAFAAPEAAIPAGLARLGATLPEFLGGAGLAADAAPELLAAAGKSFGKFVLGGGAFGGVTGFGQAIQSADQQPGGATKADALKAAAESPLYAAAGLIEPGFLRGALSGAEGNIVTRVVSRALSGAAVGAVQSGVLAGLDQTFRPDLTPQQKMGNIVDAAVTGASVGGVFGGATGVRALKRADPAAIDTDTLAQSIDQSLAPQQQQPSPLLGLPAPPAFTDAMGRTVVGSDGADVLHATPPDVPQAEPALFGPSAVPDRAAIPGSTVIVGRRGEGGQFTSEATGVEQPPVVPEDTSRSYRNMTDPELFSAANALANKGESHGLSADQKATAQAMMEEIAFRRDQPNRNDTLTKPAVSPAPEAVEQPANRRGTGEQNSAVPASTPIQARIDELTDGLRLPATLKDKLASARSEHDIQNIVHDEVIVEGKSGKMRDALAERAGVLDNEGKPTPLADEISARKTEPGEQAPTPAADAAFQERWKQDVQQNGQKDPAVRALKPTSEEDAQTQIYQALGDKGVKSDADGLEKIAQKYGVLDENKQLTPMALEIAKRDPIPTEDAVKAAVAQGYKGAEASMFDKGVQSAIGSGEKITEFNNSRAGEAYQAGAKWAEETNSVPKGALTKYDPSGRTGEVTDEQRALGAKVDVKKAAIPPEVRQGQLVNEAIDNAGLHPVTHESEIAQLKGMVRSGDIEGAMKGLQRVQRGESLFEQPERAPAEPFKGEVVTRGAPKKAAEDELVPTKATTRAAAEKAISKYELGKAVESAHKEGAIDDRTKDSLTSKLNAGKLNDVREAIPTKFSGEKALRPTDLSVRAARRDTIREIADRRAAERAQADEVPELPVDDNGVIQHPAQFQGSIDEQKAMAVQQRLEGKSAAEVADILSKHAPNGFAREVSNKIKSTMAILKQAGIDIQFKIAHAGDVAPDMLREARGLTVDGPGGTTVWINGLDGPGDTGLSYEVVQHEMLHAVTMQAISHVENTGDYSTRLGKAVKDLQSVSEAIQAHFSNRLNQGDLTDLEKYVQSTNALDDPHEVLAFALSSPEFQRYLDTIDYTPKQTLWGRFVEAMRGFLGLGARQDSALNEVLRASEEIMSLSPLDKELDMAGSSAGEHMMRVADQQSPQAINQRTKDTISAVVDAVDKKVDLEGARGALRRGQLYATTIHHITEHYGPWFDLTRDDGAKINGVKQREATIDFKEAVQQRHAQLVTDVMDRAYRLAHEDRKAFETTNRLMDLTQFGIHPARGWEQQIKEVRDNASLKPLVEEANNMYRSLQTKGHVDIYNDLRKFNDVMMLAKTAMSLHDHVSTDRVAAGRIAEFADSPMRRFMDAQAREGYGLEETHKFWNDELNQQTEAIETFAKANELHPPKGLSTTDTKKMSSSINTLRSQIEGVAEVRKRLDAFPNFHLGRDGEYFVDMKLRLGADGKVDPTALAAAAEKLQDFGRVISPHSGADHIYFRVDNTVAQSNLLKAAEALQKTGIVRGDKADEKTGAMSHAIVSGKRSDDRVQARLADQWSNRLVEEIAANEHITAEDKKFLINTIRAQAIDLTPDNSLSKVMAHRDNVPGFDPDMLRSFNSRAKVSVDALAGMSAARDITDSYANMREAVQKARTTPTAKMSIAQRNGMTEVADELSRRDKDLANAPRGTKALDQLQAVSGAFFLSANVAYPAVNLIQVPMIALPELGARYGYTKTARAMASATPESLKIIRAIAKNGLKISASRAADAVLTMKALKDAGVSNHKAEFLMQVANRGGVDIGGASRELARNAKGTRDNKVDQGLRIASALGYYSETLSRLVVALAEYQLHPKGLPIGKMADTTVRTLKESMWDYSSPNTSRMLSRNGFLGKMTPLATQFMKYTAMLNEKLYREVHAAVGGDARAQRFLLGHLAMTAVFAGTLGLPFASVFASTYDRLKDWVAPDGQPSDIQASYRNFLSDMLGKGPAEIIARGTPRAAGIDLSTRVGEQAILPFSQFISDRRDLKDSLKDLESRAWGAPSSMMLNMATGAQRVAQGDFVGGFRQMLPLGLAGMVKAYQMTDKGFTDSKGNVLPMEPSARDILAQAVGFNPAQNAEYGEARFDQQQRSGLLAKQATQMRSSIVDAMISGDHDKAHQLISQAVDFDKANPSYSVLRGIEGNIKRRSQAQAVAQHFNVPLGVNPRDTAAPPFTRYADVEFQAQ